MHRLIYVVDRNREVRGLIQEFLVQCDADWTVRGFDQPAKAVVACRQESPDALLLDLSFPDTVGSGWMEDLRLAAPLAMRMVMAVEADSRLSPKLSSAHQYLCKPFVFSELYYKMRRAFEAASRLKNEHVKLRILSLRSIPSLPKTYYAVVTALQEPRTDISRVAGALAQDSGLTTTLLRLANSPLFGTHVVSDLLEAMMVLGTERLKAILVSHEILKQATGSKGPIPIKPIWDHSYRTAAAAKRISDQAELPSKEGDAAFLGGLLHNTGRFVLMDNFENEYRKAIAMAQTKEPLSMRERKVMQVSGEDVTGFLLDMWGLSEAVVNAATFHEHPWDEPGADEFNATTAVYLANHFEHQLRPPYEDFLPPLNEDYLKKIVPKSLGDLKNLEDELKSFDSKDGIAVS